MGRATTAAERRGGKRPSRPARAPGADPLSAILDELDARTEAMARRMLEQYQRAIPSYGSLPDETLRQVFEINLRNLKGFIAAMRTGRGPSADELASIVESASKRAREGVPLSALLAAYRMGAQIAWGEARELIGASDPDRLSVGLALASDVMRWVDTVSGAVAQSYLEEYERISSDREAARRDFVDGAIAGVLTPDEVHARAEALGLDPDQPTAAAIVAFDGDPDHLADIREAQHAVRRMLVEAGGMERTVDAARGGELVVLFQGDEEVAAGVAGALRHLLAQAKLPLRAHAGVGSPRERLTDLPGSYREATIALTAARAGASAGAAMYGEVLVEELILRERGVSRRLAASVLEPLDAFPDLRETLVEYIKHGPNLPMVAKRLFLHPNTVAYRLSRIRELTGRDPKSPAGISELYLALRAAQLVGDDGQGTRA